LPAGDIAVRLKRKLNWDIEKAVFIDDEQANKRLSKPCAAHALRGAGCGEKS